MLQVHHLDNSRSQRILWLLEELGAPYEIVQYKRGTPVPTAPPELKAVHPLGRSPVITDRGRTIAESGAIIEYILDTYGNGRLKPEAGTADYFSYLHWLHYAEGSAMLALMVGLFVGMLGEGGAPLQPFVQGQTQNNLSYMENAVKGRAFLVGNDLTGADIQITFVLELADARGLLQDYPALKTYITALQARPAYKRAIEKGGPYDMTQVSGGRAKS